MRLNCAVQRSASHTKIYENVCYFFFEFWRRFFEMNCTANMWFFCHYELQPNNWYAEYSTWHGIRKAECVQTQRKINAHKRDHSIFVTNISVLNCAYEFINIMLRSDFECDKWTDRQCFVQKSEFCLGYCKMTMEINRKEKPFACGFKYRWDFFPSKWIFFETEYEMKATKMGSF